MNTSLFMRIGEVCADRRQRDAPFGRPAGFGCRGGPDANRASGPRNYSGSRYYPEIAPFSPHFVGTTFYSSHTMMKVGKRCGLIASSEARIVDARHASNRLSEETQSAARRRIEDRKQTDKRDRCEGERLAARLCRRLRPVAGSPTSSTAVSGHSRGREST